MSTNKPAPSDKQRGLENEITAADIEPKDVNWLWWPRIAAGTITIIGARGGTGKGLMVADLAARITRGSTWPLKKQDRAPKGKVLWCETEDLFAETVVPRLIAAKADRTKVILKKPKEFFALDLREYIEERDIRLIIMSPFNAFLKNLEDSSQGQHVRKTLDNLNNSIEDTDCAVVGLCHLNKKADLDAIERLLGSVEYVNFVRNVLLLNSEGDDSVRVVHAKQNISKKGNDIIFTKVNREPDDKRSAYWAIEWSMPEGNVDQDTMFTRKPDNDAQLSAGKWLVEYLAGGEWHEVKKIISAAEPYSYSENALLQARQRNKKIEYERTGFGAEQVVRWRLVS